MSRKGFKKFEKYDDEEEFEYRSRYLEKKKSKAISRALRTKDVSLLMYEEDEE